MLFGIREEFEYFECASCGCLQIKNIPENISKYYPNEYKAFSKVKKLKDNVFKSYIKHQLTKLYIEKKKNVFLFDRIIKKSPLNNIKDVGLTTTSAILDIGSGSGHRLINLWKFGFSNITGTDPFIKSNIFYVEGLKIYKKSPSEINQQFDFIMLNHSFEHMPNPLEMLQEIHRLLRPGNFAMIRIPVAGSYSWKKYGVNWVALDAPRHFFLHTTKSITILANKAGFQLKTVTYDSSEYQFWGSEQYLSGMPMYDDRSYYQNKEQSIFSKKQIKEYKKKAEELNAKKEGDAACFYLYKSY
jgi:2-polyprenyl-3-methyl-5-hydroxy-6-metoxy-1,4-benzoquinol methylase